MADGDTATEMDALASIARALGSSDAWSRGDAAVTEVVREHLDHLVITYTIFFETTEGTPAERHDELVEAKRSLKKLMARRGWLSRSEADVLALLTPASDFVGDELKALRARSTDAKTASPFEMIVKRLPSPKGAKFQWQAHLAVQVLDAMDGWEKPDGSNTEVDRKEIASLLARIEAVALEREPTLLGRTGLDVPAVYRAGHPEPCRVATDRWRQIVKSVRAAELAARR